MNLFVIKSCCVFFSYKVFKYLILETNRSSSRSSSRSSVRKSITLPTPVKLSSKPSVTSNLKLAQKVLESLVISCSWTHMLSSSRV